MSSSSPTVLPPIAPAAAAHGFDHAFQRAVERHLAGDLAGALGWYERALAVAPDAPAALDNMGVVLEQLGRRAEAIAHHRRALERSPRFYNALSNLGGLLRQDGAVEEAEMLLRSAIDVDPARHEAHRNLGTLLLQRGDAVAAAAQLTRAAQLAGDAAELDLFVELAIALSDAGSHAAALALFDRVLALDPRHVRARWNRSLLHLLLGDFAAGWEGYASRWAVPEFAERRPRLPGAEWAGEPLEGRTILLYVEQGAGDLIHLIRYAARLAARGARVLAGCDAELAPLIATCPGVHGVVQVGDRIPPIDFHCSVFDLPRLLGDRLDTIPAEVPYLRVPDGAAPSPLPPARGARRVGLMWRGAPQHPRDAQRSVSLDVLRPVLEVQGIEWVSLQMGSGRDELARLPDALRSRVLDTATSGRTWRETARLVSELDLVITVDTSIAHLAGALGRPVWILLAYTPDFRWLLGRDDSPWYPTARLFRQPMPGVWGVVVEELREALGADHGRAA